jgi:hypothetical protein
MMLASSTLRTRAILEGAFVAIAVKIDPRDDESGNVQDLRVSSLCR